MKVLVTGASGFLGAHLARHWAGRGAEVRCLVRRARAELPQGTQAFIGDILEPASLELALAGVDVVCHCAALVGGRHKRTDFFRVNSQGLEHMLAAAGRARVKRFIHLSTSSVLGGATEDAALVESGDHYRDSKVAAERMIQASPFRGMVTIIRPGMVYGPGERNLLPMTLELLKAGRMFVIAGGRQKLHTVFIDHVVAAVAAAGDRPVAAGQAYNITDGRHPSMLEFLETLSRAANLKSKIRSIPYALAYAAALAGETWETLSGREWFFNLRKLKTLMRDFCFSIEKAQRELAYSPTVSLEEGLRLFVADYVARAQPAAVH